MKKNICRLSVLLSLFFICETSKGQALAGSYTIGIDYPDIASAITALNTNSISASTTIEIPAGYTETVTTGGYTLTCSGTSAAPIVFRKNGSGANPLVTAYAGGTGTPGTAFQDGVWRLVGTDYITINGIDITDPNSANPATMEFGYGLFKASATDGCQFNTIKNCVITLNRINNAAGTAPATDGSRGIDVVNALTGAHTTVVSVTSASGTNSNNMFYSNTIQNCNIGIALIGFAATTPFTNADQLNDIGGLSAVTGNTIINFGGGAATSPAAAVRTLAQYNLNVSYNTVNNNTGAGVNHATTLRGIYINTATSANSSVTSNTITLNGGGTSQQLSCIENAAGSTAASNTINISNNSIVNGTYSTATSAAFYCILNSGTPAVLNISGNIISNNNLAGTGTWYGMESGSPPSAYLVNNSIANNMRNAASSSSGTSYCMKISSPSTLTASGNTVEINGFATSGSSGSVYGFYGLSSSVNVFVTNNIIRNLSVDGAGSIYGIREWGTTGTKMFQNNQIYGFTSAAGASMYGINVSVGTLTISGNTINSLNSTGGTSGSFYGIYISSSSPTTTIYKNKIYDISSGSTNPSLFGINLSAGTNTVYNNLIGDLRTPAANASIPLGGIYVSGGTTSNLYYNTVYLNATSSGALFGSSALYASTTPNVNLRNNILINLSTPNGATGFSTAYRRSSTTLTTYSATSNNNIFYAGTPGTNNLIMYDGTNSYQTFSAYQAAVATRDANSLTENTPFLSTVGSSATFLHIDPTIPSSSESGAVNIAGITDDYDGDIRQGNPGYSGSGTAPDIGADEFNQALVSCSTVTAATITNTTNTKCDGQTAVLTATGVTTGSGIVYQWMVSNSLSGPYSNVSGGSGANSPSYTTGTLTTGTYYYTLLTTCTISAATATSNIATVFVNPIPTASITTNSPLCSGSALTLMGGTDVGTSFMWSGPSSFTSSSQNPTITNATTGATGIYTLTVSAAGCTSTPVSASVTVNSTPTSLTISPLSSSICAGSSLTITASGGNIDETLAFGTQANQNTASTTSAGYPAPYTVYYGGQRMQMLILASELSAAGFAANSPITSVQFPVVSKGTNWGVSINDLKSFQVNIGLTSLTALTSFQSGLTNVVAPMNYTPVVGYSNIHVFSSPFIWDGVSNVILESTFSNNIFGATADLVTQYNTPTTFSSTVVYRADNISAAAAASAASPTYTYMARPDFKLNGMGPGTFIWSPSSSLSSPNTLTTVATPTTNTNYTLVAINGSCSSQGVTSVSVNPLPSITVSASPTVVCAGDSSLLMASGASTYSWSTGSTSSSVSVSPSVTATYTVDGTNSCGTDTKTITLTVNPNPTVTAVSSSSAICTGNSATLTAGGAITYTWTSVGSGTSIVVTPSTSATYTVEGTDSNGCMDITSVNLTVNPNPTVSAVTSASILCTGNAATLTASGASTYSWTGVGSGASVVVSPTTTTTYMVEGIDSNGCTDTISIVQVVSACTGIQNILAGGGIMIYPNPSNGILNLVITDISQQTRFEVYDALGKQVMSREITSHQTQFDLSELANGIYAFKIFGNTQIVKQGKLVKE